ncbi:MAG: nucleoside-diphosphate sugar epimerase, partial [Planctomycetaceae bacterium]
VFNIGSDQPVSVIELARKVLQKTGSRSEITFLPYHRAYSEDFEDVQRRVPCVDLLLQTIGRKPVMTLDQILEDIIAWKTHTQNCWN